MGSNGDIATMPDETIQNALQELADLEKDFAAVEIDARKSSSSSPIFLPCGSTTAHSAPSVPNIFSANITPSQSAKNNTPSLTSTPDAPNT